MAQRRMFSKTITNSSRFLMMSQSAQNLYFHFGMNADDDGFCEHFTIMRMTESKPDDLAVLQAKGFVKIFDDRILVVTDWRENNYLRNDRYTPSKYLEIYKEELKLLALNKGENESTNSGIPMVSKGYPQDRLGKDRLGQVRGEGASAPAPAQTTPRAKIPKEFTDEFLVFWKAYPVKKAKPDAFRAWLKLHPAMYPAILEDIEKRKTMDRQWVEGYIPHPATYLNGSRWEDDMSPPRKTVVLSAGTPYTEGKYSETDKKKI